MRHGQLVGAAIAVVLGVFGVVFFLQTRDPMVLIFALIAGGMAYAVGGGMLRSGRATEVVKVRCRSCRTLSPEEAQHCMGCGQPL